MPFFDLQRPLLPAQGMVLALVAPLLALADTGDAGKEDAPRGAFMASRCSQSAQCPRLDEVYATTPPFRHALSLALRHNDQAVPEWVKDKLPGRDADRQKTPTATTATPMLPLRIDERTYILGRMSDPQDARHRLVALYDTQRGFATLHYVDAEGKAALLGDETEILRKVIADYLDADSSFAQSLARPDVALPVPVRSH